MTRAALTPRLVAVGGAVVDCYQDLGRGYPGGNGPSVAVHAARHGASSAFLGVVGADPAGAHFRTALGEEGVEVSRLRCHPGPTPVVIVRREATGECICVACPVHLLPFDPGPEDQASLAGCDLIHLADTSRLAHRVPWLAERGRLSYDFGTGPSVGDEALLPFIWLAALSRPSSGAEEAAEQCRRIQGRGPEVVVVTRGRAGATVARGRALHHQPAAPGLTVDTLGAGDAFLAGLAVNLLSGEALAQAAAGAAGYTAAACSSPGAFGHELPCPPRIH